MIDVARISDPDPVSLAERVQRARSALGGEVRVSTFTLWYTTRPPIHHAVLRRLSPQNP